MIDRSCSQQRNHLIIEIRMKRGLRVANGILERFVYFFLWNESFPTSDLKKTRRTRRGSTCFRLESWLQARQDIIKSFVRSSRLGGSGVLALRKDQADWWRSPIPRSVSVDAVNTEARGRVRSLCWAKDITKDDPPPTQAMSDSFGKSVGLFNFSKSQWETRPLQSTFSNKEQILRCVRLL